MAIAFHHFIRIDSIADAYKELNRKVSTELVVEENFITEEEARNYPIDTSEKLSTIDDFELLGGKQTSKISFFNTIQPEIWVSSEKRPLFEHYVKNFNAENFSINGQPIEILYRIIPSIEATRMISAGEYRPDGLAPSNIHPYVILESQGLHPTIIEESLVPNIAGLVIKKKDYKKLSTNGGEVEFSSVVNAIASGQLSVGYPNPLTSSSGLNFLMAILSSASIDNLTLANLHSQAVKSVFDRVQENVSITTPTTLDVLEAYRQDSDKFQIFPLEYQNYQQLKSLPEFEDTVFIPYGIIHSNPLIGFMANTPEEQDALAKFAAYVKSPAMQQKSRELGFVETDYFQANQDRIIPNGNLISQAQSYWKTNKDGGKTVYSMVVVDNSGSMREQGALEAVKAGLNHAAKEINLGNQIGLITFNDYPTYRVKIDGWNTLQHQKFLAAVSQLKPEGETAFYDAILLALSELMEKKQNDPNSSCYLLVLTDGESNRGFEYHQVQKILEYSGVSFLPIAYGNVNRTQLEAISIGESSFVTEGTSENIEELLHDLFSVSF